MISITKLGHRLDRQAEHETLLKNENLQILKLKVL